MPLNILWLQGEFPHLSEFERLAEGGQKSVFGCRHPDWGRCVLKIVLPRATARIDREIEAVRRLAEQAANRVPEIHDYGLVDSPLGQSMWLIEQRVEGAELSEILRAGPLERDRVLDLAFDLVSIVREAESVRIVHRDIKPGNIMIDNGGTTWLLDFGIARILDLESMTQTGAVVGPHTAGYSAPEQFNYQKDKIDSRSDLFAIGVVLYECATGTNPFTTGARDPRTVLRRVGNDPLPTLVLGWDTGGLLADFIAALTQKYPHQRPLTCQGALSWLGDIIKELRGTGP